MSCTPIPRGAESVGLRLQSSTLASSSNVGERWSVKLSVVRECNTQFSVQLARWLVAGSYRILCEVASCT